MNSYVAKEKIYTHQEGFLGLSRAYDSCISRIKHLAEDLTLERYTRVLIVDMVLLHYTDSFGVSFLNYLDHMKILHGYEIKLINNPGSQYLRVIAEPKE